MRDVVIVGVGAHATGRFMEKPLKALAHAAIAAALEDAGAAPRDVQTAWVGNSLGGLLTGQEGIRGPRGSSSGRRAGMETEDDPIKRWWQMTPEPESARA